MVNEPRNCCPVSNVASANTNSEGLSNDASLSELCVCVRARVCVNICAQNCRLRSDAEMGKGTSKDAKACCSQEESDAFSELKPAAPIQSQTHSPAARKQNVPTAQAKGRASTEPKRATNASTARSSAPEHLLKMHKRDGTFSMKVNEKTSVVACANKSAASIFISAANKGNLESKVTSG